MSYYGMDGLEQSGWKSFLPVGSDWAKAAQGTVGVLGGAVIAKVVANAISDIGLKKSTDATTGVTSYTFTPKGAAAEITINNQGGPRTAAQLDAGRWFGGRFLSVVPGLAPVLVGVSFYARGQTRNAETESTSRVMWTSIGLGMLGYGLGHVLKSILERVDIDYAKGADPVSGAYPMKAGTMAWAKQAAAVLPFGAVDTYESNLVINGLGYAGGVRGYMRNRMNGLGYSRNAGAPTFVERLNSAPTQIQTLAGANGVSAAPSTIETVNFQGLAATLM